MPKNNVSIHSCQHHLTMKKHAISACTILGLIYIIYNIWSRIGPKPVGPKITSDRVVRGPSSAWITGSVHGTYFGPRTLTQAEFLHFYEFNFSAKNEDFNYSFSKN